jgi:hypothetical protein
MRDQWMTSVKRKKTLVAGVGVVAWDLSFVQVAGFTRQAPPQSPSRHFCAHSETKIRRCCPHLSPRGTGEPESFARLPLTRAPSLLRFVSSWASPARSLRLWRGRGRIKCGSRSQWRSAIGYAPPTQTPGPAPLLRDIVLVPVFALERARRTAEDGMILMTRGIDRSFAAKMSWRVKIRRKSEDSRID